MLRFEHFLRRAVTIAVLAAGACLPAGVAFGQEAGDAAYQQFVFAYRLFQRGDDAAAAEAFDEYLGKFPRDEKHGDGVYYRALLAQRKGDLATAAKLLEDAAPPKLLPPHAPLLLKGQVNYGLGKYPEAVKALEAVPLDKLDPALRASTLYLRGLAYRESGNALGAAQALEAAAQVDSPMRGRALLEKGRLLAQGGKPADAIATLQGVTALPDRDAAAEAGRFAGDLSQQAGQNAKAIEFYRAVIAHHQTSPEYAPAVLGMMWSQMAARQYDEVLKSFDAYGKALPGESKSTATYLAGSAQQELGQHDKAIATLAAAAATPGGVQDKALYKVAVSRYELSQFDAIPQTLQQLKALHPESPLNSDGELLLAAADAKRGDPGKGVARLTGIIEQGGKHPAFGRALIQRGKLYQAVNEPEKAIADYMRYTDFVPPGQADGNLGEAVLRLMELLAQVGKNDTVASVGDAALTRPLPALVEQEVMFRRAMALVRLNRPEDGLAAIDAFLKKHAESRFLAEARYYRGLLLTSLRRADEGAKELRAAAALPELNDALRVNALRVASLRLREAEATAEAAEVLQQLEKVATPANLKPDELLWLARHFLGRGDAKKAASYLPPVLASQGTPGPARAEALLLTGRSLRMMGDPARAIEAFRQVVALGQGFELQARLDLAKTLREAGQAEEALSEFSGLITAPASAIAADALLESAILQRQIAGQRKTAGDAPAAERAKEEAVKLLKRLVLLYSIPQVSPAPELGYLELSELNEERGDAAEAAANRKELIEKFPDGPYATYAKALRLLRTNTPAGRTDAQHLLKKLAEGNPGHDPRLADRIQRQLQSLEATS